jgi:hypothetical protein
LISRLYDVQDKSGLLEVFYEEFISTMKITPKKIRKETVQLLYMKRLIYLKNGQSLDLLVSPPKERSALKKVVPDISRP